MKEKTHEIIAITKVTLVYPYEESVIMLIELANIWNMRLLQCDTHKPWAMIEIPSEKFKTIFHTNPRPAVYNVPSGAEGFIKSVEVKEIIVREIKNGKDSGAKSDKNKKRNKKTNRKDIKDNDMNFCLILQIYYLIGVAVMMVIYTRKAYIDRLIWQAEKQKREISDNSINIGLIIASLFSGIFWIPNLILRIKHGKRYGITEKQEVVYRKDRGNKAII